MILSAMFLNPGGPSWGLIVFVVAVVLMAIGFAWIWVISRMGEDPDRSFSRLRGQRGGGSRLPAMPALRRPTDGWLLTRGAIAFGVCAIAFAVLGPLVLRRWDRAFDLGPLSIVVWFAAIGAAVLGTIWMIRIARRRPEDGAGSWRYRV